MHISIYKTFILCWPCLETSSALYSFHATSCVQLLIFRDTWHRALESGASRESANAHYSRAGARAEVGAGGERSGRARRAEKKAKGGRRESILGSAGAVVPKQTVDGAAAEESDSIERELIDFFALSRYIALVRSCAMHGCHRRRRRCRRCCCCIKWVCEIAFECAWRRARESVGRPRFLGGRHLHRAFT